MALLEQVREGMAVHDRDGAEIGTVEFVHFGDEDPSDPGSRMATPSEAPGGGTLVDFIGDAFSSDSLPEEFRQQLLRRGFVRVDARGFFAADRYVLADQIATVSGDRVVLSVSRDEIAKR